MAAVSSPPSVFTHRPLVVSLDPQPHGVRGASGKGVSSSVRSAHKVHHTPVAGPWTPGSHFCSSFLRWQHRQCPVTNCCPEEESSRLIGAEGQPPVKSPWASTRVQLVGTPSLPCRRWRSRWQGTCSLSLSFCYTLRFCPHVAHVLGSTGSAEVVGRDSRQASCSRLLPGCLGRAGSGRRLLGSHPVPSAACTRASTSHLICRASPGASFSLTLCTLVHSLEPRSVEPFRSRLPGIRSQPHP